MRVVLKPSTSLALSLALLHLLAAGVVFLTMMPVPYKAGLLLMVAASLVFYVARDALLLLPRSWQEVSIFPGEVSVVARNGSRLEGKVAGETFVSPYFIALGVRLEERRM